MEICLKCLRLYHRRAVGRDGTNERHGLGINGQIIVECIIKEREEMWDFGIYLKETPQGKLRLGLCL